MKKTIRLRSIAILPFLLALINVASLTGLKEVSKPYLGTYECEYLRIGEENILDKFDYVRFELNPKGIYKIEFKDKNGVKGVYRGHYSFDEKNDLIVIDENIFGKRVSKSFSARSGEITTNVLYGDTLLSIKFKIS